MKNNQYVMYLWQETEMRRKEKEERKKMMQNQKSNLENDEKKEKNQHDSIEKKILNKEKKKVINELEVTKLGATVYDFLINTKQNDVVQSPSQGKQQKNVEEDVGTSDQQYDAPQEKRLKYLGQETEMRRKEKEEHKKMMENQKSNLENDEKKKRISMTPLKRRYLTKKRKTSSKLEVTKLGATVYDFLINTKQNDVLQSPSQAKQQKNVEEDVGTFDQQYDAPQEKQLKYLGQETEMRRKEKEEHKKMMENQKSNLENDEKKEKNQHDSIEKKILNKEKKNVINELEVTKLGATVYDFLINTKQNDVVQSPSQAKQQKNVEEDVGTFDQQYDAPQEKQLKYLGQETEMRRKEKEEHKKMMENQKSNLENDEKKEKNQHDSIEKKILNKEKKNVIKELEVTKLGATVYDFLINTKQNDVVQSPSQAKQQKNVEEDVGTFDQQYDAPQEKQLKYLGQETEMRRKEKEEHKKMMENQKSNLENDEKKEKNQHDSIEKKILNKEKKNIINELEVTKLGATVYDFLIVLKYLGQETEMRRKEKEEHKKMMENQKSNLENDEKKEKNQHDSIEKKILNKEKKNVINELEVTKLGATVYDFPINIKQNDVVQSPSQAKQQKNVEKDVGTFDQQYNAPQEKRLKYLGQETEMRRKEKEEHKKMMENQKSNLENDEKNEKNQHDSIEKKILNKEKKNVINELEVTKLGATVYDFLINTKQNDVVQSPSQAKQQKNVEKDVGTSDQQYDAPQEKRQKME